MLIRIRNPDFRPISVDRVISVTQSHRVVSVDQGHRVESAGCHRAYRAAISFIGDTFHIAKPIESGYPSL